MSSPGCVVVVGATTAAVGAAVATVGPVAGPPSSAVLPQQIGDTACTVLTRTGVAVSEGLVPHMEFQPEGSESMKQRLTRHRSLPRNSACDEQSREVLQRERCPLCKNRWP